MLFKIAWRNIWRNRVRSMVVISAVAIGLFAGMFIMAFFQGAINQEIESMVETQLSHIQFHNPAFIDDKEANDTITNGRAIVDMLKQDRDVKADFDYEERPGTDAVRAQYNLTPSSSLDVAFSPGKTAAGNVGALMYHFNK